MRGGAAKKGYLRSILWHSAQSGLAASGSTLLALAAGPHTLADAHNPAAAVQFTVAPGGAINL
jgi:hypothetical protein